MKKIVLLSLLLLKAIIVFAAPLSADDIFKINAKRIDPNTFALTWDIKQGYFLYKDIIKLIENKNSNFEVGKIAYPDAMEKMDKRGNTYQIYKETFTLPVSILGREAGEDLLDVRYQGCSQDGFCYPPQTKKIKLVINPQLALTQVSLENEIEQFIATEETQIENVFSSGWWLVIASFFGFGILLSFTPCVLPMVPVLSGIIVGHGHKISTRKAFLLSLSYVLSMSFTYALVGTLIASLGSNLQMLMQSPISISIFSSIFILLALSMFNFYELRLPTSWQSKLAGVTRTQQGGQYLSAAVMGCLSTLILSPCITAPLIGALGYIAQTGNIVEGGIALFFLGLGMGFPLLILGTSAGKLLPKAGVWMNSVKSFFGVLLLAVAIYMLDRILPALITMGLWGGLFIFSGLFMGAFSKVSTNTGKLRKSAGVILLLYGLLLFVGASKGNTNPLSPLTSHTITQELGPVVTTLTEAKKAIIAARGTPVLLDFYADWCASCKIIKATTLQDKEVIKNLSQMKVITIDLTANSKDSNALLQYFKVIAPPTFVFLDKQGKEINTLRMVGEISSEALLARATKINS